MRREGPRPRRMGWTSTTSRCEPTRRGHRRARTARRPGDGIKTRISTSRGWRSVARCSGLGRGLTRAPRPRRMNLKMRCRRLDGKRFTATTSSNSARRSARRRPRRGYARWRHASPRRRWPPTRGEWNGRPRGWSASERRWRRRRSVGSTTPLERRARRRRLRARRR